MIDSSAPANRGNYVAVDDDLRDRIDATIREVLADGVTRTIDLPKPVKAATTLAPEWRSKRGLTLTEEMDREDTDY
jgi:hypothetical protein